MGVAVLSGGLAVHIQAKRLALGGFPAKRAALRAQVAGWVGLLRYSPAGLTPEPSVAGGKHFWWSEMAWEGFHHSVVGLGEVPVLPHPEVLAYSGEGAA